jgi:hypothetical protein
MCVGGVPHIFGKFLKPQLNQKSTKKTIGIQNDGSPNFGNFKTFDLGVSRKMTFGCNPYG